VSKIGSKLTRYPGLMLLIGVYAISCLVVIGNYRRGSGLVGDTDKVILRIAHWQLEPGIQNAVDYVAAEYEKLHPDVEVRQILIPEEGYFRWVNTQLIGRTAPDMIECGLGGSQQLWQKFYARYFIPLDQYVDAPNPYNAGTEFEKTPWRLTYFDEMEGGYEETLQSYFRVPLSAFTLRLYYNKDMVAEVWPAAEKGSDFPRTYEEFLQLCDALAEQHAQGFVPMAGAQYSFERIDQILQTAFTANYLDRTDVDYDGAVSGMESAGPLYSGRITMREPAIRANFAVLQQVADYSPAGATSLDRDEAVFLFLQGNAAMNPTGSWDFSSLTQQAEFNVAVTDFPLPTENHPEYGQYVAGQPTEADTRGGFPFAISKVSRHPDMALDFLQFCSSLKMNAELNRHMFWLPVILGAKPRPELAPFTPRIEGYSVGLEYEGPNTRLPYEQKRPLFLSRKRSYDDFVDDYMDAYRTKLPEGVGDLVRDLNQTLDAQMRRAAHRRAAIHGVVGAAEAVIGEPAAQYGRIIEAYAGQVSARNHEVGLWTEHSAHSEGGSR
jgi:raffinose/stachyose/melibiose transport system substrate-binding protein